MRGAEHLVEMTGAVVAVAGVMLVGASTVMRDMRMGVDMKSSSETSPP